MIGDMMLAFFLVMPAIVAVTQARRMTQPLARAVLFWGGIVAVALAVAFVTPMLACDGDLRSAYTNCSGAETFTKAQPLLIMAAKIYVLVGIPLGVLAFMLETVRKRA